MPKYSFTDAAEHDLERIIDHTLEYWGAGQAEKYVSGLKELAQSLAENPKLGVRRNDLLEELLIFSYSSHILYYFEQPHGITIIRILHGRMDANKHISKENIT